MYILLFWAKCKIACTKKKVDVLYILALLCTRTIGNTDLNHVKDLVRFPSLAGVQMDLISSLPSLSGGRDLSVSDISSLSR